MERTFSEVYAKAAAVIREYGWTRNTYGTCEKGFCASGALQRAVYGSSLEEEVMPWNGEWREFFYEAANRAVIPLAALGFGSLSMWNDKAATREDVLALFDRLAEEARLEEGAAAA